MNRALRTAVLVGSLGVFLPLEASAVQIVHRRIVYRPEDGSIRRDDDGGKGPAVPAAKSVKWGGAVYQVQTDCTDISTSRSILLVEKRSKKKPKKIELLTEPGSCDTVEAGVRLDGDSIIVGAQFVVTHDSQSSGE